MKAASFLSVLDNYVVFQEFWDKARDATSDSESRARIHGLKAQISKFDFQFRICLGECVIHQTDNFSKTLQSPMVNAADCQPLVRLTCTLASIRNDESFSLLRG